jgi:hypothetical protein
VERVVEVLGCRRVDRRHLLSGHSGFVQYDIHIYIYIYIYIYEYIYIYIHIYIYIYRYVYIDAYQYTNVCKYI